MRSLIRSTGPRSRWRKSWRSVRLRSSIPWRRQRRISVPYLRGPVLSICLQSLDDRHHAEDAFQAVFLVLARKARSIRDPNLLGAWLYGVALRTARKARGRLARRRKIEEGDVMRRPDPGAPVEQPLLMREQSEALHREIDRLPRTFRLPVV